MSKCSICKKEVDKNNSQYMVNFVYCDKCYPGSDVDSEKSNLYHTICEVFNIDEPTELMYRQIRNYTSENISYRVIDLTLQYLDRVCDFKFELRYGIGIVKFKYDEMINHYNNRMIKRKEVSNVEYKSKTYNLSIKNRKNKILEERLVDMSTILEGGSSSGEDGD